MKMTRAKFKLSSSQIKLLKKVQKKFSFSFEDFGSVNDYPNIPMFSHDHLYADLARPSPQYMH